MVRLILHRTPPGPAVWPAAASPVRRLPGSPAVKAPGCAGWRISGGLPVLVGAPAMQDRECVVERPDNAAAAGLDAPTNEEVRRELAASLGSQVRQQSDDSLALGVSLLETVEEPDLTGSAVVDRRSVEHGEHGVCRLDAAGIHREHRFGCGVQTHEALLVRHEDVEALRTEPARAVVEKRPFVGREDRSGEVDTHRLSLAEAGEASAPEPRRAPAPRAARPAPRRWRARHATARRSAARGA